MDEIKKILNDSFKKAELLIKSVESKMYADNVREFNKSVKIDKKTKRRKISDTELETSDETSNFDESYKYLKNILSKSEELKNINDKQNCEIKDLTNKNNKLKSEIELKKKTSLDNNFG